MLQFQQIHVVYYLKIVATVALTFAYMT